MLLSLWECRTAIFRKSKLSLCSSDEQGFGKALVWKYGSIFERKESRNSSTFGVGEPLVSLFTSQRRVPKLSPMFESACLQQEAERNSD